MTQADSVLNTPRTDSSSIPTSESRKPLTRRGGNKRRKRATEWTNEEIALARRMLAEKRPDSEFRERLGKSKSAASARIFRANHHEAIADWTTLRLPREPRIEVPPEVRADADRRAGAPRSLTAWQFGDPAPGCSALDKRRSISMKRRRRSHRR